MSNVETKQTIEVEAIREILSKHGRISVDGLVDGTDLYTVGLTSLATVGVMLAIEERFDIEFPESMLSRGTFRSVESIADAVAQLAS